MASTRVEDRRQEGAVRNDERILDAGGGGGRRRRLGALVPARVAAQAGLSHPAVSARFSDRSAIGAGVWRARLATPLIEALRDVLAAAGLLGSGTADPGSIASAMRTFTKPDVTMCATAELLIVGSFDAQVRTEVQASLGTVLAESLTPSPRRLSKSDAARRSIMIITALGSLLEIRRQEKTSIDLTKEWERTCDALPAPDSIERPPDVHLEHWDGVCDFNTGDSLLDRLLEATRDEIGRKGYEATTIDSIAAATGRTKGAVFSRYPSKKQLFTDTTDRYTKAVFDLNEQAWNQMLQTVSPGAADAVLYREFMRPGRDGLRVFALEQYRLAWHDPEMREAIARAMRDAIRVRLAEDPSISAKESRAWIFIESARGLGAMLLACCYPESWSLPYQHMTVPLNAK